jgi:UDP-glucose 4-epimerase
LKILVTGGVGFIGTNLVKRLLKDGHEVISLDNYSTGVKENEQEGCDYINVDISDSSHKHGAWGQTVFQIKKPDVIYHLGALARIQPSLQNPTESIENNMMSTLNVLEFARLTKTPVVFAGSSSKHYGVWGSPYAWSKWGGEQLCELYNKVYNLPVVTCRFYNVYGPHQILGSEYAAVIGIWLDQFQNNKPLTITGDGEQRRDFTHVDDIVDGLIRCGENIDKVSGEDFELGSGVNYSMNEITAMFGDYPTTYIPPREGEYDTTLCIDTKIRDTLGWNPQDRIEKYIKEEIGV